MNIRWADDFQQCRNQSTNHLITIDGKTMCMSEWTEYAGLKKHTINNRLRDGKTGAALIAPRKPLKTAEINGETKTLVDWSKVSGIAYGIIKDRLRKGKTGTDLIALPKNS